MKKRVKKKLRLHRETVRQLDANLGRVMVGGTGSFDQDCSGGQCSVTNSANDLTCTLCMGCLPNN